jgi:hypothetical protein
MPTEDFSTAVSPHGVLLGHVAWVPPLARVRESARIPGDFPRSACLHFPELVHDGSCRANLELRGRACVRDPTIDG